MYANKANKATITVHDTQAKSVLAFCAPLRHPSEVRAYR